MAKIYICIGSNVDRVNNIARAIEELERCFGGLRLSSVYESNAMGFDGDPFFNVVAALASERSPLELISIFRAIEAASGRSRDDPRLGPRTLDLDLLLYDDQVIDRDGLVIPRREITEYAFVLCPLAEIAGALRHPVTGETYADMWSRFDGDGQVVRRVPARVAERIVNHRGARTQHARPGPAARQGRAGR